MSVRAKRVQAVITIGLLLFVLLLPQLALAESASISLSLSFGRCGDVIQITADVPAEGTYRICWGSPTAAGAVETFTTTGAGSRTIPFTIPTTAKGTYSVYLTTEAYVELAAAALEVIPFAQIDPTEGPVSTNVTISGSGFAASQDIRVGLSGTTTTTDRAGGDGSWTLSYTIPSTPGGSYVFEIEVQDAGAWVVWMERYFRVTPQITVSPPSGNVGQTVQVTGTGFASNEDDVQITFDGEVRKQDIPVQENGSWSAVITIPACQSGPHVIDASGVWTRARDIPDVEFIVGAGILLDPTMAYVGDTITVTGGGFLPGETGIRVTFQGQTVTPVLTADSTGSWEASFDLPPSTHGSNTVSARGDITAPVTFDLITLARIESFSPVEGAPGDSVTLTGSGFHGNQQLTVLFDGNPAPGDLRTRANGDIVITFQVPATTVGMQTVVVRDGGGATDSVTFTVRAKVLSSPAPILPEDGSKFRPGEITFRWGGITGDTGITYVLEISNEAGNVVWSQSGIEEFSYLVPGDDLPHGTYYWRVKAVDEFLNESLWSSRSSFTIWTVPTWVWVIVGVAVVIVLMVVAYRETKFKVIE